MSDADQHPSSSRPAVHLLDELESIKGALADNRDAELPTNIPLLDDVVIDHLGDNANLLNIEQIFDEGATLEESAPVEPPMQFPRFTLDVAISDDGNIAAEKPIKMPATTSPTVVAPSASAKPERVRPDYSREMLIQELVDEFIPQIEAELHKRMQQLDDAALHSLKDSK